MTIPAQQPTSAAQPSASASKGGTWLSSEHTQSRAQEMGRKSDPFAAYSMPPAHPTDNAIEVPEGYVVGTAAVLGGGKGLVGNEGPGRDASGDRYLYGVVKGLFKQSDPVHERMSPEEMLANSFGLIDQSPERWANLKRDVAKLQAEAPKGVRYKVIFCGRHGQGYHNAGAAVYDALEWEFVWAKLNGDDKITWGPDAELTKVGEGQALAVQNGWKANLAAGAPKPETFWVSPLTRTANTMRLSFGELLEGETPVFVEGLREIYGEHTCDKRRSKSYLKERFPDYTFEEGFAEDDPWWKADEREQEVDRRGRMRKFMDKLFDEDDKTYVSLTSHSCAIRSMMAIVNHEVIALETGEMIPFIVQATRQQQ